MIFIHRPLIKRSISWLFMNSHVSKLFLHLTTAVSDVHENMKYISVLPFVSLCRQSDEWLCKLFFCDSGHCVPESNGLRTQERTIKQQTLEGEALLFLYLPSGIVSAYGLARRSHSKPGDKAWQMECTHPVHSRFHLARLRWSCLHQDSVCQTQS